MKIMKLNKPKAYDDENREHVLLSSPPVLVQPLSTRPKLFHELPFEIRRDIVGGNGYDEVRKRIDAHEEYLKNESNTVRLTDEELDYELEYNLQSFTFEEAKDFLTGHDEEGIRIGEGFRITSKQLRSSISRCLKNGKVFRNGSLGDSETDTWVPLYESATYNWMESLHESASEDEMEERAERDEVIWKKYPFLKPKSV